MAQLRWSATPVKEFDEPEWQASGGTMIKTMKAVKCHNGSAGAAAVQSVADILERELQHLIKDWLARVDEQADLTCIQLNYKDRTGHLPQLLHDVIARLRLDAGSKAPISKVAAIHGDLRRKQGYSVAMVVEESRLLQVTIFSTLHNNVKDLEFRLLLPDIVTIAGEVDAQLKEQMLRFMAEDTAERTKGN
jgi:two-component sensor histidine kinase